MLSHEPDVAVDPFYVRDLEQMARAVNYIDWIFALIAPHVRGDVLEIGSGIGSFTTRLAERATTVTALEPNRYCFERLIQTVRSSAVTCLNVTVEECQVLPQASRGFDSVVCLNVMEHIRDDVQVLTTVRELVRPQGVIVLVVPAVEAVYGEIDRRLGHYRRYSRSSLRAALSASGWRLETDRFFNSVGLLGWLFNAKVRRANEQSDSQIAVFDRLVVPVLRRMEAVVPLPVGQSLIAVAVNDGPSDSSRSA